MPRIIIIFFMLMWFSLQASATVFDIEADRLEKTGNIVEAQGEVIITGEDAKLTAEYMVYDIESGDIWATGSCTLKEASGEMKANTLYYNTIRKDAYIEDGSVLIYKEPVRITGKYISRYGEDLYTGEDIEYTPCLGDPPAWSIRASDIHIPIEGYGKVTRAKFRVYGVPVLYTPYLFYPVKLKRQSGLLFPSLGNSSDTGYRYSQPVYIVTSQSTDVTLTPTFLSKRGVVLGGEFRYRPSFITEGKICFESLHDKRGGGVMEGGVLDEIPSDRWFLKAFHKGDKLRWDINLVSDEDYLDDIGTFCGEDLVWDNEQETLISRAKWVYPGRGFIFGISGQWKQDLTNTDEGKTIQEIPKLQLMVGQKDIPMTPLKCSVDVSSTKFYTQEWVEGIKDVGIIEVSAPVTFSPYLTVRPWEKEIYRDTIFTKQEAYTEDMYKEHWQERGVSLSTALYSPEASNGWYHQIVPEVGWLYRSRYGGNGPIDEYPQLLEDDEWVKTQDIDVSLTNFIRDITGDSRLEFRLGRTYDRILNEWGLAETMVDFTPCRWFSLKHTNEFDINGTTPGSTHLHSTSLSLSDTRGDAITLSEEYGRGETKCLVANARTNLGRGFSCWGEMRHDYRERRYEYLRQGISWNPQCWGIDFYREVEPSDDESPRETSFYLTIRFLGMGDVVDIKRSMDEKK